jgi:BirA family biotin operon repressor/biotin-[acetyl-CoA-carboxylase] ligase
VADALHALGHTQVGLKWPNDLLADARKLGGILVEVGGDAAGPLRVVVGVGINVAMPPQAAATIDQPWTDLATLSGSVPSRRQVAAALLDALLPMLARFERDGLAPFLPAWNRYDALAGRAVRVQEGDRVHEGVALGIDAGGALRLRGDDGVERRVHAGEASLRAT